MTTYHVIQISDIVCATCGQEAAPAATLRCAHRFCAACAKRAWIRCIELRDPFPRCPLQSCDVYVPTAVIHDQLDPSHIDQLRLLRRNVAKSKCAAQDCEETLPPTENNIVECHSCGCTSCVDCGVMAPSNHTCRRNVRNYLALDPANTPTPCFLLLVLAQVALFGIPITGVLVLWRTATPQIKMLVTIAMLPILCGGIAVYIATLLFVGTMSVMSILPVQRRSLFRIVTLFIESAIIVGILLLVAETGIPWVSEYNQYFWYFNCFPFLIFAIIICALSLLDAFLMAVLYVRRYIHHFEEHLFF